MARKGLRQSGGCGGYIPIPRPPPAPCQGRRSQKTGGSGSYPPHPPRRLKSSDSNTLTVVDVGFDRHPPERRTTMEITIGERFYEFEPWKPELGRVFRRPFAFDCETTLI